MSENGAVQDELTLRQIVDGISALVAVLTPDGAVEIVNRQVLDYFGKALEEMRAWSSSDAVHPDDLPAVIAVWTRSIDSVHDEMIPVSNSYRLSENLANAILLTYPDAGHGFPFQYPDSFTRHAAAFLSSDSESGRLLT
jgi:pimeloyl-ACP methyl ester carboxylesterase